MVSNIRPLLFYALLALLLWLPIPLGSNRPWAWSLMQIATFLITIGCIYLHWNRKHLNLTPYKLPIALWVMFLAIALLQIIPIPPFLIEFLSPNAYALQSLAGSEQYYLSLDVGQSQINFYKGLAYFCLFISTLVLVDDERKIRLLLTAMLASGALQALYGTFEILSGTTHSLVFNLPVEEGATGSFVYRNHYANFLILTAAAGIGLIVTTLQQNQTASPRDFMRSIVNTLLGSKALIRICLAIMVIGLVMSRSRMGNTAFFVSMTLVGLLALVLIKQRSKGLTILIVSMLVIDLFIVSAWFGLDKVQERLTETSLTQEGRDEVVLDALPMISDYPIFGTGGGSFYSVFPMYKEAEVYAFYDHAHNDYLQMAIEYGPFAAMLLGCLVLFCLFSALIAMHKRKHSILKGSAFACSMAIVGMLIHMTVDFPIQASANASYFVVFLALSLLIREIKLHRKSKHRSRGDQ